METAYTPEQITQAMLHLGFDSDQICNLLNRLKAENGNPGEGTAEEKYVKNLVASKTITEEDDYDYENDPRFVTHKKGIINLTCPYAESILNQSSKRTDKSNCNSDIR